MAWHKIPKEHHPLFEAALPADPRVETIKMFGGVAGLVNGHMFGGLWADTVCVRVPENDRQALLSQPGFGVMDPMGKDRPLAEMVLLPKHLLGDTPTLRGWLERALEFTATKPPKAQKPKKKAVAKKAPAKKAPAKKAPAKRRPTR